MSFYNGDSCNVCTIFPERLDSVEKFPTHELSAGTSYCLLTRGMRGSEDRLRAVSLLLENPWGRIQNKWMCKCDCECDIWAMSSAGIGRQAKRETAMVLHNVSDALWQVVSITPPPIFEYDIPVSKFFCESILAISDKICCIIMFNAKKACFAQGKKLKFRSVSVSEFCRCASICIRFTIKKHH